MVAAAAPSNPDAVIVELQSQPSLPENIAAQLSFLPPEGGAGGTGSRFNCLNAASPNMFSTHVPAVGIGGTITFCYSAFVPGPAVERIFDPSGRLVRELPFELTPDSVFGSLISNNFTPNPEDPIGTYRVEVETAGGSFKETFEVQPFQGLDDVGIAYARLLKPIGRSPSATPTVGETEYMLAVGFAPNEMLEIFFYKTCRFTGRRRADQLGYTYLTGAQARVNRNGYAFFSLPDTLREQVSPEQTYTAFARGDVGVTAALPPDILPWDVTGAPVNYSDPAMTEGARTGFFDGGFDPDDIQLSRRSTDLPLPPCESPSKITPAPTHAPEIVAKPYFPMASLPTYDTMELAAAGGRLYAHVTGVSENIDTSWNLADRDAGPQVLAPEQQPRRLEVDQDTQDIRGGLSFLADNARYIAGPDGNLRRIDPAIGVSRQLLSAPVDWHIWRVHIDARMSEVLYPALTVADDIVYFGGIDSALHAVDSLDGKSLWRAELPSLVSAPPAVSRQTVYAGTYGGTLYALDIATGNVRWSFEAGDWLNTPVVAGDTVYITAENNILFALDAQTGAERWRFTSNNAFISDPLLVDDIAYIAVGEIKPFERTTVEIFVVGTRVQLNTLESAAIGERYRTIPTDDGFVAVRARPSATSAEVARLPAGSEVLCEGVVVGEELAGSILWAYCPAVGGYIFYPLLQDTDEVVATITPIGDSPCRDTQGDVALPYTDLIGAEVQIEGERLSARFQLAAIPITLVYNKTDSLPDTQEYAWEVAVFLDGVMTDSSGYQREPDYSLAAIKVRPSVPQAEREAPLESFVQVDLWSHPEPGTMQRVGIAELLVDYTKSTLTLSGSISGLTPNAVFLFSTFSTSDGKIIVDELSCG